ncbi:class I SAM-dependent rRNA methyltransferase [Sessilibacter sp. MAH4]
MSLARLQLKPKADRRLKQGHLWIYSNEIDIAKTPLKNLQIGEQAEIVSDTDKVLGVAVVNPNGLICARLISRDNKHLLNKSLLVHRINQAKSLRELNFADPYYRLVYGDSDLLPGLIVDRFGDTLVVQIASAGMEVVKQEIVDALDQCLRPKGILIKNDHSARELENLPLYTESLGEVTNTVELVENSVKFIAPIVEGQKTGWFYDHRCNREYLQKICKGKRVLDIFSYVGGWGVQAAVAGATDVTCIDASEFALDIAFENAKLNGVEDKLRMLEGKAVPALKALIEEGEKFDVVVLDPPAFIKRKKDQKSGEAAYYHVNELAMRLLNRDGVLVSASCSMHMAEEKLIDTIRSASRHLDRQSQIFYRGCQGPDHPVHPAIPETNYLKALFARVYRV